MDSLGLVGIGLLIVFSYLSFSKMNMILFMVTGAISIMLGLEAPDIIDGASLTTPSSIAIGLVLIVYALFCMGASFRLMFWSEAEAYDAED